MKSYAAKILYGLEIPPEKFDREILINEGYLTLKQYRDLQKTIYETREFGLLMEPVEGVAEAISQLLNLEYELIIVTSRDGVALEIAREWCAIQDLNLDLVGVGYGTSKASACTNFDVYIDDDLEKLEQLIDVVPNRYLFSWGYNNHVDVGATAQRINSWKEFCDIIESLVK